MSDQTQSYRLTKTAIRRATEGANEFLAVYMLENSATGEKYIGSSQYTYRRLLQHRVQIASGRHPNPLIRSSFKGLGLIAARFRIVERITEASLPAEHFKRWPGVGSPQRHALDREQHWIRFFDAELNWSSMPPHATFSPGC